MSMVVVILLKKRHYQTSGMILSAYKDSKMRFLNCLVCLFFILGIVQTSFANDSPLHIAVSSSIEEPIVKICQKFSQTTGYQCKTSTAPTGHLYAHIMHGMSYDLFLSSDETYTQGLVNAQKADQESRYVVAMGRVVLWSPDISVSPESLHHALTEKQNTAIVIANPGVSAYGGAAKEVLQAYNLWNQVQGRLIYSKGIKHAYQLLISKRVPMGFISLAQLSPQTRLHKRYWEPDPKSYKPVLHEIIVLKPMQHEKETLAFMAFLRRPESCQILEDAGFSCSSSNKLG